MNQSQQPFSTDFQWTPPVNVDGEFALSAFYGAPAGQHLEMFSHDAFPGVARYGRQTHPKFSVLCKAPSNYVTLAGKLIAWLRWTPEQDAGMRYLIDHLDETPLPKTNPYDSQEFDWNTRTIIRRMDYGRGPKKTWVRNDFEWDFGMPIRFESLGGLSLACVISENLYGWEDHTYRLPKGHEVSVPRESGKRTYIVALDGEATLATQKGSVPMSRLQGFRLLSGDATVTASKEDIMVLWRRRDA